jgi:hypothetical protein
VDDPLVGAVVLVGEELAPAGRHGLGADGVAVVLGGHVAAACALQPARLVVPSVPVPEGTEGSDECAGYLYTRSRYSIKTNNSHTELFTWILNESDGISIDTRMQYMRNVGLEKLFFLLVLQLQY